jgi:signal transduction histidine kinase
MSDRSPTGWLLTGLAVSVAAVGIYAAFTIAQIRSLRTLQAEAIDRNRADTLLLLRIQNDLNSIAMTMRDMLDGSEPYPLTAWRGQLRRIRGDLEDALKREARLAPAERSKDQQQYLSVSFAGFWDAVDRMFMVAESGDEAEARTQIRLSLQARQAALSTAVSRLLIQNNEEEQRAAVRTQEIYDRVERNVYGFLAAMIVVIVVTGLYIVRFNRRMFGRLAALSERRSELAQQLIATQENTYRYISRELHDEFGQILTAMGAMMQRLERRAAPDAATRSGLHELREIAQTALEKVRTLSQALHPVILEESGLDSALEWYLPAFQTQTGIAVRYERTGAPSDLDPQMATHLYRVLQEALNNVTRHSRSPDATVRLDISRDKVLLEVEDNGVGFGTAESGRGMGMAGMRERAELIGGVIEFLNRNGGGALVRLTVPLTRSVEAHAG